MNNRFFCGLALAGGVLATALGLAATGCMPGTGTTGTTASLSYCIQAAQQIQAIAQTDSCQAARLTLQAIDAGCYSYLSYIPGAAGQVPSEADSITQLNAFLASPYCTGM